MHICTHKYTQALKHTNWITRQWKESERPQSEGEEGKVVAYGGKVGAYGGKVVGKVKSGGHMEGQWWAYDGESESGVTCVNVVGKLKPITS